LLGGTGSDHNLWTHHLPALASRFRVIVPDPRGTGATTRPSDPTTCTMRAMAGDAAGLLDGLGLGPAHVAGLSLGSAVAMELVATGENDIQVRPDYGRQVAELIPGARFHLFRGPRASHCSCLEMQDEFLRETFAFVDAMTAST